MNRIVLCVMCALFFTGNFTRGQTAPGQPAVITIYFKDGRTVGAMGFRRVGDIVMATQQIGTGTGEVGYPANTIEKIDFPEPGQIKAATDLLLQGKAAEALSQIEPIVTYYAPFKDVPGAWWLQAIRLKLSALASLRRDRELEAAAAELTGPGIDPETARAARVQVAASWARKGDYDKAMPIFDETIKNSTNEDTLALAWLSKADGLLAQKDWEPALLAYLHLPVFYPDQKLLMPQALLGSARAYAGIEDFSDAQKTFEALGAKFPSSPEAAVGKTELEKLLKKHAS